MRTANRNIVFLYQAMEQIENNTETIQQAIKRVGTPKEIDSFFDKFSTAFGKWLLQRNERTLEHSVEELLEAFRDYQAVAPDNEQVDYDPNKKEHYKFQYDTHAPGSCPL